MSSSGSSGGIWGFFERTRETVSTSWSDLTLPSWLTDLKSVSGTLIEFGKDPKGFILSTLLLILIEQVLGFATATFAFILLLFEQLAGIPITILNSLGTAGSVITGGIWTVGGAIYRPLLGAINSLGWTAPLVFALLFVLVIEATEEFSLPVASALTDLLGAIPVVGSVVDALLSMLINVARSLIESFGGES